MDAQRGDPSRTAARVWWLCGLLFLATVLNYLDRQVLSLTAERILEEFELSREGLGEVIASFRYAYALFQIGGGWMVDVWGARGMYPLALGVWSLAGVLTGLARSVPALAGYRFLLGAGEAFNWPCALQVTRRLVNSKDRALANGIFNSGAAAGAMLAPVLVTAVTLSLGWRAAFLITGMLGMLWILAWFPLTRPFSRQLAGTRQPAGQVLRTAARILSRRAFWWLAVSAVIVNSVNYFLADWIPLYLKTERGFSFAAGNALSILIYASLEAGNLLLGWLVKKLVERGWTLARARRWALGAACLLMSSAPWAGWLESPYLAVACLMLTALGVASFLVIYLTLVQEIDPAHVGASAGLLGGLGNLAYGFFSPWIGRFSDLGQTAVVFLLVGLLPWLALGAIWLGVNLEEPK